MPSTPSVAPWMLAALDRQRELNCRALLDLSAQPVQARPSDCVPDFVYFQPSGAADENSIGKCGLLTDSERGVIDHRF
jgi:hypothetical protein